MFGYRSNVPKVRLTTDRLVVRLVHDRDAWRLADYYAENRHFLKPWVFRQSFPPLTFANRAKSR